MKNTILVLLTLVSFNSFAWGPVGHRATGVIAEAHLSAKAQAAIRKMIGGTSLADIANWADQARASGKYRQTAPYHYEKIHDNTKYIDELANMSADQRAKGGVVGAILQSNKILRSSVFPAGLREDALKFLVHFIGDAHQPLHTGKVDDRGGNEVAVTWFGQDMNLHKVWDSGIILTGHSDILITKDDGQIYAEYLMRQLAGEVVNVQLDLETWIDESMSLRAAAYDPMFLSNQQRYLQLNLREVDLRVYKAGLRIAAALNAIFGGEALPDTEIAFIRRIEKLTGPMDKWIYFTP